MNVDSSDDRNVIILIAFMFLVLIGMFYIASLLEKGLKLFVCLRDVNCSYNRFERIAFFKNAKIPFIMIIMNRNRFDILHFLDIHNYF